MLRATHRLNVPATLLLGIVLWPGRAHADDEAAGRVLFNDAMAQVKRGQLNEACPKFEESLRQSYNINAHYFLADCWERQGRTATAWTTFLRVATNARDANDEGREAAARKRAESLEPKLVRLRILVTRDVDGLEVRRNGNLVGRPMWTEVVPVDPGDVEFTATAPGFEPFKTTVSLSGEGKTVDVRIPELIPKAPVVIAAAPSPAKTPVAVSSTLFSSPPSRESSAHRSGSTWRTVGWVGSGVGLATVAAGGVVALLAKSFFDSARNTYDACQDALCRDQNLQKEKKAISDANVATGLFIGGGAVVAVGMVLVLTGSGESASKSPSVSLRIHPSGLSLGGSF